MYPVQKADSWFFSNPVPISKQVHKRIVKQALRKRDQFKVQVVKYVYAGYFPLPAAESLLPAATVRRKEGKKLFNHSLEAGRLELAYLLISHMASTDYDKVLLAISSPEPREALLMLVRNNVSLNGLNASGYTVLSTLAREIYTKKVELLLSCGADVNSGSNVVAELYKEKKKNWRHLVGLFLEHGSVIDALSEDDLEWNYFFNITKGSLFHHAIEQNDYDALKMFLTKALFEPSKKEVVARQKRVVAALCVFKRLRLLRDINLCILKHLYQNICSSRHCSILHTIGYSWQELLPYCTISMIKNMYVQAPVEHRPALLQEILNVMVIHRKANILAMLESQWVLDLSSLNLFFGWLKRRDLAPEVFAALDPLQVEQYDKGIREPLCNVIAVEVKE